MQAKTEQSQKAGFVPGKKPAAAGVTRSRTTGGRGHQHSNSTPPLTTTTTTTAKLGRTASSAASFGRSAATTSSSHARSQSTSAVSEMTTVLVGRKRQAFVVNRRLLCAASPFFRDQLQQKTHSSPMAGSSRHSLSSSSSSGDGFHTYRPITLWLPGESTTMFGLFVEWLHSPSSFRSFLDDTAVLAHGDGGEATQLLHWALVRLHLFAAHLGLLALQDLAMDAIQDLYLRCDWDIAPSVIAYLYTRCEARHAVRLRRWAVAMAAFSLTVAWHLNHGQHGATATTSTAAGPPTTGRTLHQRTASASSSSASAVCDPARLHSMLDALPEFRADYATHVRSMRGAGLDMRFKNPQLRIPANALRNDKRVFGFRECSFHSHRAAVGQGPCPHASSGLRAAETGSMLDLAPPEEDDEDDDESDDDTRQWEREWADEYRALEAAAEYTYVPTTSLRPPPPPPPPTSALSRTVSGGGGSTRPLVSRFGHDRARSVSRG
ncbi:hypothetical protein LEL_01315 [Akanthomyces lecanii RCEF 1005]|uniref:BTB domain-containing protein n=1 Tax=Akanthomyces lecanii RCEF 1005 TaxID=1081108 RepID=A0A168KJ61_CORDF|nr:hypothetical protein LEL_01315 [Akanthomyces lecanii RCEF 1005]